MCEWATVFVKVLLTTLTVNTEMMVFSKGIIIEEPAKDQWGNSLYYIIFETSNKITFVVGSNGPDQIYDNADDIYTVIIKHKGGIKKIIINNRYASPDGN